MGRGRAHRTSKAKETLAARPVAARKAQDGGNFDAVAAARPAAGLRQHPLIDEVLDEARRRRALAASSAWEDEAR